MRAEIIQSAVLGKWAQLWVEGWLDGSISDIHCKRRDGRALAVLAFHARCHVLVNIGGSSIEIISSHTNLNARVLHIPPHDHSTNHRPSLPFALAASIACTGICGSATFAREGFAAAAAAAVVRSHS